MAVMTLSEFMKANALDDAAMAEKVGASAGAVKKWKYGERTPRPQQIARITVATKGAVTALDFVPSIDAAAVAAQ
jgi:DNA-binding transcriptional regulator YdaS (Cro superfamily)